MPNTNIRIPSLIPILLAVDLTSQFAVFLHRFDNIEMGFDARVKDVDISIWNKCSPISRLRSARGDENGKLIFDSMVEYLFKKF